MSTKADVAAAYDVYRKTLTDYVGQYGWTPYQYVDESWLMLWFQRGEMIEHARDVLKRIDTERTTRS